MLENADIRTSLGEFTKQYAINVEYCSKPEETGDQTAPDEILRLTNADSQKLLEIAQERIKTHLCLHEQYGTAPCQAKLHDVCAVFIKNDQLLEVPIYYWDLYADASYAQVHH